MPEFYTKEYILQRLDAIEQEKKYLEKHFFSLFGPVISPGDKKFIELLVDESARATQ